MENKELLGFLEQLKRLLRKNTSHVAAEVSGNRVTLKGDKLTKWRDGWKLFRNLERLRMLGVLEIDSLSFEVNRERLQQEMEQRRKMIKAELADRHKTIAELFIRGNTLNVRIEIGDKSFERRVQRLNYGSNIEALLAYGLSHPGKLITLEEVQATRKQSDFKLRDIADTLSKDKAKALEPLLNVFFDNLSKHTVTVRPMASIGMNTAREILHYYDK